MPVRVLTNSSATAAEVVDQLSTCKSAAWAIAWATPNKAYDAALTHIAKFHRFVVGTHSFHTAPECLREFRNHPVVVVRSNAGPLFHPKLYVFEHEDRYTAIVGSHNLTRGAFEKNIELSTVTDFEKDDPAVQALLDFIETEANENRVIVSNAFLARYEDLYRIAKRQKKDLDRLYVGMPDWREEDARKHRPIYLDWGTWFKRVRDFDLHGLEARLEVLRRINEIFNSNDSFAIMSEHDRRRVAGLATPEMIRLDGIEWNYFGDMSNTVRFGQSFGRFVIHEPQGLSDALELIPMAGPVSKDDWEGYWNALMTIAGEDGGIGRATATRLACVKRPDVFVPLNKKNEKKLAKLLDVKVAQIDSGTNYWDRVVEPMRMTPWWSSDRPHDDLQAQAWDRRGALLDALVYDRDAK
jgi:hypothetical protein